MGCKTEARNDDVAVNFGIIVDGCVVGERCGDQSKTDLEHSEAKKVCKTCEVV